jgi:isochorismate pyruvate lyase
MEEVRTEIDRIDDAMVRLLAERWGYVDRAWQLKERPEQATVPWRIQQVIDRVRAACEGTDVPPGLAEALWRQIIGWGIQHEQEKLREKTGDR